MVLRLFVLCGGALALAGCSSHSDAVCRDVGDCSHGGDSAWIESCQAEARALRAEADAGCSAPFDTYYACADSNFSCQGATSEFNGCDVQLRTLDQCFATAAQYTSCDTLTREESHCALPADSGTNLPPACTAARDCEAQCYLQDVSNVCAPRVNELDAYDTCALACPP